jgi:hypothetical protein
MISLFNIRPAFRGALTAVVSASALFAFTPPALAQIDIPSLTWTQRSDWLNVKSAPYNAKGDGVTDDTAAIQAALMEATKPSASKLTVYLPAGTYKITGTLDWQGANTPWTYGTAGVTLVGCGRDTVIKWYGASGRPMFWTKGAGRCRYIGIAWDGRNIASCAYEAASAIIYESRVRHEHESFRNFSVPGTYVAGKTIPAAGIVAGLSIENNTPDAEVMIWNCLFNNCTNGVIVGYEMYNNYQWEIKGCQFEGCGTGILCNDGKTIILDNHFEGSTVADITTGAGLDQTVRRCTSVGSKAFFVIGAGSSATPQVVQDCWIDGWTGTAGAIQIGSRGPAVVYDTTFTRAPNANPPIVFTNSPSCPSRLLLSAAYCPTIANLVNPGPASTTVNVPSGARIGDVTSLSSPATTFLQTTWPADSTHILDVTLPPYNAANNGTTDDTAAIQSAINDAKAANNGSIVYLPAGGGYRSYLVTSTLVASGSNYKIQGSGKGSVITWGGATTGAAATVINVSAPQNLALEQLCIHAVPTVTEVLHTSTGASSVTYDGLWCYGPNFSAYNTDGSGLVLSKLPAGSVVYVEHLDGALTVDDCGPAEILGNFVLMGRLIVNGATKPKTGFLGILDFQGGTAIDDAGHWDVLVDDNQDLVIGHYYQEQGYNHLKCNRGAATWTGRLTIDGVKQHFNNDADTTILINNYAGRVMYAPAMFAYGVARNITQTGTNAVDLILAADAFSTAAPNFTISPACRLIMTQNIIASSAYTYPADVLPSGGLASIAAGLDHQRQLGWEDLRLNYGIENVVPNSGVEADAVNPNPTTALGYTSAGWRVDGAVAAGGGVRNATVTSGGSPFGPGAQAILFYDTTASATGTRLQLSSNTVALPPTTGAVFTFDFRLNPLASLSDDIWIRAFSGAGTAFSLHLTGSGTTGALSCPVGGTTKTLVTLTQSKWYRLQAVIQPPSAGKQNVQLYLTESSASGPVGVPLYNGGVIDGSLTAPATSGFTSILFNQVSPGGNTSVSLDNVTLMAGDPLLP